MKRILLVLCFFSLVLSAVSSFSEQKNSAFVNYEKKEILLGYPGEVLSIAFSPDGKILAIGTSDKKVVIWDVSTWQILSILEKNTARVMAVAFSPDSKILASGDRDNKIYLWDTTTWKVIDTIKANEGVETLAFNQDASLLAIACDDKTALLWNIKNKSVYKKLTGHKGDANTITFSPDGTRVATGSRDNTVILWDVASGNLITTLYGHSNNVQTVAYSPDGKHLATGGADNLTIIWDAKTGKRENILTGSSNTICSVSFVPNTNILMAGNCKIFLGPFFIKTHVAGSGCNLVFWDIESAKPIKSIDTDCSLSSSVFSSDARYFAVGTATHDGQFITIYERK